MSTSTIIDVLKRQEELHPDLKPYLESSRWGQSLKHPFLIEVLYVPQLNALYNERYKYKLEYSQKALEEKDFQKYIWLCERPYRMQKFIENINDIPNEEYWSLLGDIWADSENLWQYKSFLGSLLNKKIPHRENMMSENEKTFLIQLPEQFIVYRGHQVKNRLGHSWTLSYWRAKWFSERFKSKKAKVTSGIVKKENVIAVLLGRNEFEIVCCPENIQDINNIQKRKRSIWINDVIQIAKNTFNLKGSIHGPWHWEKVESNGLAIGKQTNADLTVIQLFSFLHDCKRESENHDPDHGKRAAEFCKELFNSNKLKITKEQLKLLETACVNHNDGQTSDDPTIGACWDADRLDLTRVGISPNKDLLSTKAGRDLLWKI